MRGTTMHVKRKENAKIKELGGLGLELGRVGSKRVSGRFHG